MGICPGRVANGAFRVRWQRVEHLIDPATCHGKAVSTMKVKAHDVQPRVAYSVQQTLESFADEFTLIT